MSDYFYVSRCWAICRVIILKQNYIVVTFISLSLVNICRKCIGLYLCVKDPQCIVSQEDFQHKILNWSTLLFLLSLHNSKEGNRGAATTRIVYNFRSSRLEVLHKKYMFWKFWKVVTKTPVVGSCFNKIARPATVLK